MNAAMVWAAMVTPYAGPQRHVGLDGGSCNTTAQGIQELCDAMNAAFSDRKQFRFRDPAFPNRFSWFTLHLHCSEVKSDQYLPTWLSAPGPPQYRFTGWVQHDVAKYEFQIRREPLTQDEVMTGGDEFKIPMRRPRLTGLMYKLFDTTQQDMQRQSLAFSIAGTLTPDNHLKDNTVSLQAVELQQMYAMKPFDKPGCCQINAGGFALDVLMGDGQRDILKLSKDACLKLCQTTPSCIAASYAADAQECFYYNFEGVAESLIKKKLDQPNIELEDVVKWVSPASGNEGLGVRSARLTPKLALNYTVDNEKGMCQHGFSETCFVKDIEGGIHEVLTPLEPAVFVKERLF